MKSQIKVSFLKVWLYLLFYAGIHLLFLTRFPHMHSDESWLAGLSRNMLLHGDLGVTETFFDAKPRYPHAIKTLFHLLQIGMIRVFGYSLFSVRLLSLIVGCCCLFVFYHCARRLFRRDSFAFLCMLALSWDVQFIEAIHFARSEVFICLGLCLCLLPLLSERLTRRSVLLAGLVTGICVFIHPNSFLLACSCGAVLFYRCGLRQKKVALIGWYAGITAVFAALAVALSFGFDKDFIRHYFTVGQESFNVLAPVGEKIGEVSGFFARIWSQSSGTYFMPDIRIQAVLFLSAAFICAVFGLVMKNELPEQTEKLISLLMAGVGIVAGITVIGRFNQTSILFLFPIGWLLTAAMFSILSENHRGRLLAGTGVLVLAVSVVSIRPWLGISYDAYLDRIAQFVPKDARVLANLNTDFYFEDDMLRDYRNLPYAMKGSGIPAYILDNEIEYILYSDELDFIYQNRPNFNPIYGNSLFVEELKNFCREHCTMAGSFFDPVFGVRIQDLIGNGEYGTVTIYRVDY